MCTDPWINSDLPLEHYLVQCNKDYLSQYYVNVLWFICNQYNTLNFISLHKNFGMNFEINLTIRRSISWKHKATSSKIFTTNSLINLKWNLKSFSISIACHVLSHSFEAECWSTQLNNCWTQTIITIISNSMTKDNVNIMRVRFIIRNL